MNTKYLTCFTHAEKEHCLLLSSLLVCLWLCIIYSNSKLWLNQCFCFLRLLCVTLDIFVSPLTDIHLEIKQLSLPLFHTVCYSLSSDLGARTHFWANGHVQHCHLSYVSQSKMLSMFCSPEQLICTCQFFCSCVSFSVLIIILMWSLLWINSIPSHWPFLFSGF